jgi:Fe2+ transport system protein FeoA
MIATQFTCPLCGHGFDPAAHLACQTCPLHSGCHLVCCPSCGHTTVDQGQSRIVRWISTFLDRMSAPQPDERRASEPTEDTPVSACALADVPLNRRVRVLDVSALPTAQREQLHGYGLVPGGVLRVTQHAPVTVVQIEHTELALETEVARAVRVHDVL